MAHRESTRATSKDCFECAEVYTTSRFSEALVVIISHLLKSFGGLLAYLDTTTSATR
jgi:hypothetical protein